MKRKRTKGHARERERGQKGIKTKKTDMGGKAKDRERDEAR